jgi:gentisate 1,2-dioxygenase
MQQTDSLDELLGEAAELGTAALWTQMAAMVPPRPNPRAAPQLWRWSQMRPLLMRAARLVGDAEAERRVLMLVNSALRAPHTTDTLFAGLQIINPGETARAHRHVAFALRFILEGDDGFSAIGGAKVRMGRGDFVVTPSWSWHDHGHEGDAPMIWLDGLDLPLFAALPTNFAEPYREPRFPAQPAAADCGLFVPWLTMQALLDAAGGEHSVADYATPLGRPVSRTLGAGAERLAAGARSGRRRTTASSVLHVYAGSGSTRVGDTTLTWQRGDTFAVPAWTPFEHIADASATAYLFHFDDRPLLAALGHDREEILA